MNEQDSEHPLVSIIIPNLNTGQRLASTIENVLGQDYPNLECIVIDGGSVDGSLEVLQRYKERIKCIYEPPRSHADAINRGLKHSKGEIVTWLPTGDLHAQGAVSKVVDYFQKHPEVDVVYGDCVAVDQHGQVIGKSYLHQWDLEYAVEYCDHCIPQPASFIRRRILERVGWIDSNIDKQDHELWLRIGLVGNIQYIPVLLGKALDHSDGVGRQGKRMARSCVELTKKFFTLPNVPENIRKKQARAISNACLKGAQYAWVQGRHWFTITLYIAKAALADRTNARHAFLTFERYVESGAKEDTRLWLLHISLKLLGLPRRALGKVKRWLKNSSTPEVPNLFGDRDIEWSWVAASMPQGPGEALDFGPGGSYLGLIAAQRDFNVMSVDLGSVDWPYIHPNLRFVQGDLLKLAVPDAHFDLVINCSTIEHVGLVGRYGVTESQPDGDLSAMRRLREVMKPSGIMLLTIPVGRDAVFMPLHRVYGEKRLPQLLHGYVAEKEKYWVKDNQNRWILVKKEEALARPPQERCYGLGCFVLSRTP